jgi:hypothetical protein
MRATLDVRLRIQLRRLLVAVLAIALFFSTNIVDSSQGSGSVTLMMISGPGIDHSMAGGAHARREGVSSGEEPSRDFSWKELAFWALAQPYCVRSSPCWMSIGDFARSHVKMRRETDAAPESGRTTSCTRF